MRYVTRPNLTCRPLGAIRSVTAAALVGLAVMLGGTASVRAQTGLSITTPFPAVSTQPGANVTFELTLRVEQAARVTLAVEGVPDGWSASISGGGNEVQGAYVEPGTPTQVSLSVHVADDATAGVTTLTVVGSAAGESASLPLEMRVAEAAGGAVSLEADFPSLRGSADQQFSFSLTLSNDTPQQLTFSLSASGPSGWDVSVQPSGQERAASVTVDARGSQRLDVTATPPAQAAAGTYPITVEVVAGDQRVGGELIVEITGTVAMELTTPDQRLNTTANAGATRDFEVLIINAGSQPLTNLTLSGRGPSEWTIEFEPATVTEIAPENSETAIARITPSGNAVAGDYVVTLTASSQDAEESIEVRVTVETAPIWGIVGILLIAATLGVMAWVFRRYGRR